MSFEAIIQICHVTRRHFMTLFLRNGIILNLDRYCLAFTLTDDHFLIASPEKALVDFIYFYCESTSPKELIEELTDSYRVTPEDVVNLDIHLLNEIAERYRAAIIDRFIRCLRLL